MDGWQRFTQAHAVGLALLGSLFMFIGWALAIVPTFHDLASEWPVVIIALIAFGAILIPPGADIFYRPGQPGQKHGLFPVLIAAVPAALLFIVVVAVLPLAPVLRALAVALELVGMALFMAAWGSLTDVTHNA